MRSSKLISKFRQAYQNRLVLRCAVFVMSLLVYIFARDQFEVLYGFNFFRKLSIFHILWIMWVVDMTLQLVPTAKYWPLGSRKFFKNTFQPLRDYIDTSGKGLLQFIYESNRTTILVGFVWLALVGAVGVLHFTGVIPSDVLLLISVAFYVCDVICVLYWCPFRVVFMKNRCCTTCRIFNWDHIMMFSPIVFIPGFFTWTLCLAAFAVFMVWEITFALHPERFWEGTKESLRCSNCTDQLCGQRNCRTEIQDIKDIKFKK